MRRRRTDFYLVAGVLDEDDRDEGLDALADPAVVPILDLVAKLDDDGLAELGELAAAAALDRLGRRARLWI